MDDSETDPGLWDIHLRRLGIDRMVGVSGVCSGLVRVLEAPCCRGRPVLEGWRAWLPFGLPDRPGVCIASSRLERRAEARRWWLDALRTAIFAVWREQRSLITAAGMTTALLVRHLAGRLGVPLVEVGLVPGKADRDWAQRMVDGRRPGIWPVWLVPTDDKAGGRAALDEFVIDAAAHVRLLAVREGGRTARAIRSRLTGSPDAGTVWLLHRESNTRGGLREELLAAGCVDWLLRGCDGDFDSTEESAVPEADADPADRLMFEPTDWSQWLCHWTRAPDGARRGESRGDWLDRIVAGAMDCGEGAEGALRSIVATGLILGSARLTRDSQPVVSLTAVPLDEFRERRVFRPHLHRWDFECFGVAIRRGAAEALGARPVVYGDANDWNQLESADRPWFQMAGSGDAGGVDWRSEREWRVAGNLDLRRVPVDDIRIFTPDIEVARRIAGISRWRVVVVPERRPRESAAR